MAACASMATGILAIGDKSEKATSILQQTNFLVFYSETLLLKVLYFNLARQWPEFVKEWHKVEITMRHNFVPVNLRRKVKRTTSFILFIAFDKTSRKDEKGQQEKGRQEKEYESEHNILTYNKLKKSMKIYHDITDSLEDYFKNTCYWDIFSVTDYSLWKGMIGQVLNWQRTFIWSYTDVFITIISICFRYKLIQVKARVKHLIQIKESNPYIWRNAREQYVSLANLFLLINKKLSGVILLSFCANIYFILLQIYYILTGQMVGWELVYLLISFGLIIIRLSYVCFHGGSFIIEVEKIIKLLQSADSSIFNMEIDRFITHAARHQMVLTGMNFFYITQSLMLKMGTAIMAYELVIIQITMSSSHKM
ncbi:gustatory receptor for sugar taste 64f-like [Rhynchophorus ferrugineus]|uniref:gustatory receptor for sugar taste 64f-like n=1 Tax=Rhynchophorus ferrugineus TaxID=354439 RepID=UPI003FCD5A2E